MKQGAYLVLLRHVSYFLRHVTEAMMASGFAESDASVRELRDVTELLGGTHVLKRPILSQLDAHEMIIEGLPAGALAHLVEGFVILKPTTSLEKAIGMSLRTFQRHKETRRKTLSSEQGGRAWKFAEILAKATAVFGSREAAEQWLARPAFGLDQRRPIDLLATPAGVALVEEFLGRLEYGVYT